MRATEKDIQQYFTASANPSGQSKKADEGPASIQLRHEQYQQQIQIYKYDIEKRIDLYEKLQHTHNELKEERDALMKSKNRCDHTKRKAADCDVCKVQESNEQLKHQLKSSKEDGEALSKDVHQLWIQIDYLKENWSKQKSMCDALKREKDELMTRLSKLAGEKLTHNNPNIADLSDKNRPTKLGEMYSELYDNEWTDAFEGLNNAGYDDSEAIATLKNTLLNVYDFCSRKSKLFIERTTDAAHLLFQGGEETHKVIRRRTTVSKNKDTLKGLSDDKINEMKLQRQWKPKCLVDQAETTDHSELMKRTVGGSLKVDYKIKTLEKDLAEGMVYIVQQAYLEATWDKTCRPEMKPFIKKCIYIGWMMVVQSPPVCLHRGVTHNEPFDAANYRPYTTSVKLVDYIVWPAMLLEDNGALLCKGVAEAKRNK